MIRKQKFHCLYPRTINLFIYYRFSLFYTILPSLSSLSYRVHYPFFLIFYTIIPFCLTYITLSSPLHPTLPFLLSILHSMYTILPALYFTLPTFSLNLHYPPFLLSIQHYPSFSLSYTTLSYFLDPLLPLLLISILHYPSFSMSYTVHPSFLFYSTLCSLYLNLPFLLLSVLHYPSFSLS